VEEDGSVSPRTSRMMMMMIDDDDHNRTFTHLRVFAAKILDEHLNMERTKGFQRTMRS